MGLPREAETSSAHIEHREEPPALSLDERGMIRDCNRAAEKLSGYLRSELVWRHVSLLLPQLPENSLISGGRFNPKLNFLCHCGHLFHLQHSNGSSLRSELHLVELNNSGRGSLRLIFTPVKCFDQ